MAQAGFTPIQLYRTTTASAQPTAGNLAAGELAINLTDKKLYAKDASNNVFLLADASSGGTTAANLAGGATGSLPYQTGANATTFLGIGTAGQVLQVNSGATAPQWVNSSGTGDVARTTSPSFTTPSLGVATATSINKIAFTAPATAATLTIADGKSLTINNSLVFAGTDATTMTFPSTSASLARTDAAQTFTGTQTFAPAANTSGIVSSSYSLTGANAQSLMDLSGTWNTTGTPTGIKLNVTDTASNASSLLMDLQVGGVSRINVSKNGDVRLPSGSLIVGGVGGAFSYASSALTILPSGQSKVAVDTVAFNVSNLNISWTSNTTAQAIDLTLARDAANTLAQRNGVNAQTLRVYNTFTDASNYERGVMQWSGNILTIGAEGLGTGAVTPRVVNFIASNSSGSRRVATMRAASQVAMEVVGQSITSPPAGVGTLTVFTPTNGLAEAALDLAYTDGFGGRQGGFKFRDTQTSGDWVACQIEMLQSYGDGNRILSELGNQDSAWPGLIYISRTSTGAALTTSPTHQWRNHGTIQLTIDANNNIVCNNAAIATNATNGFLYVPGCAGTPTGTPTAYTGRVPIVVDTTNNKLYFYSGGAWRDAGP